MHRFILFCGWVDVPALLSAAQLGPSLWCGGHWFRGLTGRKFAFSLTWEGFSLRWRALVMACHSSFLFPCIRDFVLLLFWFSLFWHSSTTLHEALQLLEYLATSILTMFQSNTLFSLLFSLSLPRRKDSLRILWMRIVPKRLSSN